MSNKIVKEVDEIVDDFLNNFIPKHFNNKNSYEYLIYSKALQTINNIILNKSYEILKGDDTLKDEILLKIEKYFINTRNITIK